MKRDHITYREIGLCIEKDTISGFIMNIIGRADVTNPYKFWLLTPLLEL